MEIPAGSEKFVAELKQLLAEESASENKIPGNLERLVRELLDKYPEKVPQAQSVEQVPQAEPQRRVRQRIVAMVEVVPQAQSVEQVPQAITPVDDTAFQVEKQMRKKRGSASGRAHEAVSPGS